MTSTWLILAGPPSAGRTERSMLRSNGLLDCFTYIPPRYTFKETKAHSSSAPSPVTH